MKLKASLALVSLPSNSVVHSKAFYETLLGIDVVRNLDESAESYHTPISDDGIDLQVGPVRHPKETTTLHFHVDDLDASIKALTAAGGTLVMDRSRSRCRTKLSGRSSSCSKPLATQDPKVLNQGREGRGESPAAPFRKNTNP